MSITPDETEKKIKKMTDDLAAHYVQELMNDLKPPYTTFDIVVAFNKGVEFGARIMKETYKSSVDTVEKEFTK